jgi:hypothetical protein
LIVCHVIINKGNEISIALNINPLLNRILRPSWLKLGKGPKKALIIKIAREKNKLLDIKEARFKAIFLYCVQEYENINGNIILKLIIPTRKQAARAINNFFLFFLFTNNSIIKDMIIIKTITIRKK